jgi:hypothetical protein
LRVLKLLKGMRSLLDGDEVGTTEAAIGDVLGLAAAIGGDDSLQVLAATPRVTRGSHSPSQP